MEDNIVGRLKNQNSKVKKTLDCCVFIMYSNPAWARGGTGIRATLRW